MALSEEPEVVKDFHSKEPKLDPDGKGLLSLSVVAIGDGEQEIITVKSTQFPKAITSGALLKIVDLVIANWEMPGRHGTNFLARSVELAEATSATVPAKPSTSVTA